jgi:hypothetical protein
MKRYLSLIFLLSVGLILISWGIIGHRTVAQIAENHLTPQADVSTWADEVRSDPEYKSTASWHFLNLPLGLNYAQFVEAVKSQQNENVYSALLKCEHEIGDKNVSWDKRKADLKFIVHLIGDLHQPMHISRAEDKGGNTIQVQFDGKGTNLHSLWDSKLIERQGLSYTEMAKSYDTATPEQISEWQHDDVLKWVYESYEISSQLYTEVEKGTKLDDDYYIKHIPTVRQRIEKGGIRLAGVLNELFKSVKVTNVTLMPPPPINSPPVPPPPGARPIEVGEVSKYIGQTVKICSKVYGTKDLNSIVLVNVGAAYPNQLLTVVLRGEAKTLASTIDGKQICVSGKVIDYNGKPEIIVTDPAQIVIMPMVGNAGTKSG